MSAAQFYLPYDIVVKPTNIGAPGAKLYFYATGTTTLRPVYSTSSLTTQLSNPVIADGAGRIPAIYLDGTLSYRLYVLDKDGALLLDYDPYVPGTVTKGDPGGNVMAIGLFSGANTLSIATGTDIVRTSGYSTLGQGVADYVFDAAVNSAYVAANPRASFISSNGRGFRLSTRQLLTPLMFGAVGDGVTDDLAAFNAARDFLIANATSFLSQKGASRLYIPASVYFLSDTWDLKGATFIIEGDTGGQVGGVGTVLKFAADKCGVRIQKSTTEGAGVGTTIPIGADGTIIRNLALQGGGGTSTSAHGVWARCRVVLENLWIFQFHGNGYNIVASTAGGGAIEGNANNARITGGQVSSCGGDGVHIFGGDANVIKVTEVDASANGGWGFYNEGFLSNTFDTCHSAGNTLGAYKDVNGSGAYINCYSESGQPASDLGFALALNGTHGAGFTAGSVGILRSATGFINAQQSGFWAGGQSQFDNLVRFTGSIAFPGSAIANGYIYRSASLGLVTYGIGTTNDVTLANSTGATVMGVPTGTVNAAFGGTVTATAYKVGANQVVGGRGAAISDAVNAAAAPTQAEFNAFVTQFNALLARLRAATGHGLIS